MKRSLKSIHLLITGLVICFLHKSGQVAIAELAWY
jgi:hypothetical protein